MKNEMFDLLLEASKTLSIHEQAQLGNILAIAVSRARYEVKEGKRVAHTWGCPKCSQMDIDKARIVKHLVFDHKTRREMALWMPVPITYLTEGKKGVAA